MRQPFSTVCPESRFAGHARLAIIAALLSASAGCAASGRRPQVTPTVRSSPGGQPIRVEVVHGGQTRVVTLPLAEYVAGSVLSEVGLAGMEPSAATQVAQLQAVLARTYAVVNRNRHGHEGFDLCAETHCQLYRPTKSFPARVRALVAAAVEETRGQVIVHRGRPIQALFHSDCGGHTSDAAVVWGGPTPPYLHAVPDPVDATDIHRPWTFTMSPDELRVALNRDDRTRVGNRIDRVDIVERDMAGRAARIVLDGEFAPMVRGEELRAVLTRTFGPRAIRSTRIDVRRDGDRFVFAGTGFGHGVGLCQVGAIARARAGQSLESIIQHYYAGARVDRLDALRFTSRLGASDERVGPFASSEP